MAEPELNFENKNKKTNDDRQKFRDEVVRIFSDNTLTGSEQQRLDELQIELQLSDSFCKQAVKQEKENIYKQLLAKVYSDGVISATERAELTELSKRLGMTPLQAASMESAYSTISNKNITGDTVTIEDIMDIHHHHCFNHDGGLRWNGIDYRTTEWFEVGEGETYRYYEKDYIDNQYYLAVNKSFRDMESDYGYEHWVEDGLQNGELVIFDDEAALDEYICDQHQIKTIEQIENEYLQAVDKDSLTAVETALLKQRFVNPMFSFSEIVYERLAECLDYNENIELSVLKTPINYEQNAMVVYRDISDNRTDEFIHTATIGGMIDYLKGIKDSGIERDIMIDNDVTPQLIKSLEIGPLHVINPKNEHDVADILPFLSAPFPKKNSVFNKVKTIDEARILLKYATSFNDDTSQLGFSNNENYPQLYWNTNQDLQGFCESSTWTVYKNAELHGEELLEDVGTPEEKLFFNKTFPENKLFSSIIDKMNKSKEFIYSDFFKNRFGDWEKAQRLEKVIGSENIIIDGSKIAENSNLLKFKKNAISYGKSITGVYHNKDKDVDILFTASKKNGGLYEILEHDYKNAEHLKSIAAIPDIIENAIYICSLDNEDRKKHPNIDFYEYYLCGLSIDNKEYTSKMVVANIEGKRYYDHKLSSIEKEKVIDFIKKLSSQDSSVSITTQTPEYESLYIKDTRLLQICQIPQLSFLDKELKPSEETVNKVINNTLTKKNDDGFEILKDSTTGNIYGENLLEYARLTTEYNVIEIEHPQKENEVSWTISDGKSNILIYKDLREAIKTNNGIFYNNENDEESFYFEKKSDAYSVLDDIRNSKIKSFLHNLTTPLLSKELSDNEVEKLWDELGNIPFDENDKGEMILSEDWNIFKEGTEREEIWHVFDESHSKGVAYLLNDYVPEWARNKGFGKNEPEKNILSMPGTDFIDDKEKMADFEKLTKDEFLASYSYLTSDDYDKTAEMKYAEKVLIEDVKNALADMEESPEIKGVRVYFPEQYGYEKDDKLHLLVEFKSEGKEYNFKEDQLFNILNGYETEDDKVIFDGLEVDFNPITEGKSGTIEQYLRKLEEMKNEKSKENLEKAREVADWIVQYGLERSTSMENCHVDFDEIPSEVASQEWIKSNYEYINTALGEHNDNELLEYYGTENSEDEFNLYFCSNSDDMGDNTLFRKTKDGRWVRKPVEDLEIEKEIDDSIHRIDTLKLLPTKNNIIDRWSYNKSSIETKKYLFKDGDKYIAVDNAGGNCWTEEFDSIHKALIYLYSKNELEEINKLSSERAENICSDYLPDDYLKELDSKLIQIKDMSEEEYNVSERMEMMNSILAGINKKEVFNKDYATKETFINEFVKDEEAGIENKNDMAAQLLSTSVISAGLNTYPETWKKLLFHTDNIYPAVYAAAHDAYLGDSLRFFIENADSHQWSKLRNNDKYSKDVLENALGSIMNDHEFTVNPTLELADKLNRLPEALDFIHTIAKENIKDYGDMEQFQEMLKSYDKYIQKVSLFKSYENTIPVYYVDTMDEKDKFPRKRFDIAVSKDNEFLRNAFNLKDDSLWTTEETAVSVVIDISDCYKSSNVSEAKPQLAYLRIDSEKDGIHTLEEKDISIDTDSFIYGMFLKKAQSILTRDENSINYIDEIKKAGWDYVRHEDGSGHFRSPDGKKELSFDLATNEYKWNNGEWKIDEEWHPDIGAKDIYDEYVSIKYEHTYLFPEGFFKSKDELKDYNVKYDGTYSSEETGVVQLVTGTHEELSRLAEYNGYELHPDFVYKSTDLSLDNLHEMQDLDRKPPFYKDRFYKRYEPLQDEITKTATLYSFSSLYPEEKQEIKEAIENSFTDKGTLNYEEAVFISKTHDSITDAKNNKTAYLVVNQGNYNNQSIIYKLDYDKDNRIEKVTAQWENFVEQHPGHFNLSILEAAAFATEHISTVNFDSPYHGLKYFLENDLIKVRRADNNLDITEELKDYNDCYTINNEKYHKVFKDELTVRLDKIGLKERSNLIAERITANYKDNGFELVKDKNGNLFTLDKKIGDTYCHINQPVTDPDLINNYRKFRFIEGDEVCVSLEALFKNPEYIPAEFDEGDLSLKEMDSVYFMKDRYFIRFTRDGNSTYYDLIDNETGKLVCCDGEVINVTGITKYINNGSPEVIYSFANANGEETTYFELSLEQLEIATQSESVRGLKQPDITNEISVSEQNISDAIESLQNVFEWYKNGAEEDFEFDFIKKVEKNPEWIKLDTMESLQIANTLFEYVSAHHSDHFDYEAITGVNGLYIDKENLEKVLTARFNNLIQNELEPVTAEVMTFDYEKERQLVNAQVLEEPNTNYFTAPENNRNRENHQVYETNGLRVDVDTEGKITEQGWKDLSAIMDMYSNKSYETTRYLFVKDGKIIRQTAISCKIPNTTIVDEANSQKLNSYRHYAEDNDCQIIMVHNHPSGDIRPSDADIRENNILLEELKDSSGHNRLMGCVILDHGNMSIFNSENKNWYTCLKGELHEGFDVFESELYSSEFRNTNRPIVREKENAIAKRLSSLASELDAGNTWNTKDFIPIFFLNERNEIKKHEYINVSEFKDEAELKRKLKSLGTEYSSTKLYMLPTNYDNNILCQNFNLHTRMVTDIYCSEPGYKNHTLNENKNRIFTNEDLVISESDDSLNYPYFEKEVSNNTNNIEEQKYMTELGKFNTTVVELKDLSKEDAEKRLEYFNVINFKDSTGFNSEYNNITSKYFNFYEHEDERLIFLKAAEDLGHHTNDVYGNQRIVEQYLRYKFNLPLIYENGEIIHRTQEELDQYKEIFDFINFAAYDITVDNLDNLKAREIANPQQLFEKINEILRTKEFSINHEKDDISLNTQEQILNESETLDYKNTNTEIGAKYSEIKNKYPAMSNEDILSAAISESMGIKVNYGDSITTDPYENNPMATFIINHFVKYLENNDIGPDGVPMKNNGETINIHNIDELKKFIDSKPVTYERSEWMGGEVKKERILSEEIQNDIERINSIFKGITLLDGKGESKNLNELFYSQYNDETHDNYNEPKNILKNNIASLILENADFGLLSKFGKITINPEVKEQDKELYESLTHVQNIFNEARQKFSNQLADMIVAEKLTVNSFNDIQTNINEYLNKNETYLQYMKDEPELTEKFMKYQLSDSLSTKEIENKNIDTNNSSDESLLKSISINSSIMPEQNQKNNNLDPISFLQEALKLKSKEDYKQFYDTYFNFNHGRINDIPPIADNKVGLFIGDDKEPIETLKGTNSNRKQLVEKAIEEGIALFCPSPEEVMEEGQEAIKKCLKQYEFYLNRPLVHDVEQTQNNEQQQKETTPLTEALPNWWKNIPEEKIRDLYNMENIGTLVDFVKEPFTIGTRLPPISTAKKTIDGITTLIQENDWTLDKVNNNDSSVTITRMNNGIREFKKLDSTYYNHMIIETKNYLNSLNNNLTLKQHLDRTYQYEDTLGINQNETRENSAAQFWHNFEVRCKSVGENDLKNPAGNLYDAMDIAKELYSKLTPTEKKKLKKMEKSYEKETGKSYQEHLEQRYKEIFKGREIKDFDVYDKSSLTRTSGISHTQNALDDSHKLPDDLNLKIGDIVRIGVMAHDVKGRKRNLPPTDMEIKNVSKETNTIVLYDSIKKARFDIPLDTFISHQREVNLKLAKTQKKEQKKEIKKDLKIYGMDR